MRAGGWRTATAVADPQDGPLDRLRLALQAVPSGVLQKAAEHRRFPRKIRLLGCGPVNLVRVAMGQDGGKLWRPPRDLGSGGRTGLVALRVGCPLALVCRTSEALEPWRQLAGSDFLWLARGQGISTLDVFCPGRGAAEPLTWLVGADSRRFRLSLCLHFRMPQEPRGELHRRPTEKKAQANVL